MGALPNSARICGSRASSRSPLLFRAFAFGTYSDGPLHAGELAFPAAASLRQVLTILRTAHPVQHRLTIPEGLTAAQIAHLLDSADALTGDTPSSGRRKRVAGNLRLRAGDQPRAITRPRPRGHGSGVAAGLGLPHAGHSPGQ